MTRLVLPLRNAGVARLMLLGLFACGRWLACGPGSISHAAEDSTPDVTVVSLRVEPATPTLSGSNRRQQLLVTGVCD
ncbi:MAG: hypothetical protein ACK50P_08515, partial [Planctomycetaceae bacterium]